LRFAFHLLLMMAIALGVGFGLSHYALTDGRFFGVAQVGPWLGWPDIGSPQPNPYTRAHLARAAQLQLGQAEGLQFVATVDSSGRPLTRACAYAVTGDTPLTSFWTLVALDETGINIAAPDSQAAMRSTDIARRNDGSININVGTRLAPDNWLEVTGTGPFQLVTTLYDTPAFSASGSSATVMPTITRGRC